MTPLDHAKEYSQKLKEGSAHRMAMEFLIDNAAGRRNAKPWSEIRAFLRDNKKGLSKNSFQQTILSDCRHQDSKFFIGSNDHGEFRGYFIVLDEDDAKVMATWYRARLAKESYHLGHLESLFPRIAQP